MSISPKAMKQVEDFYVACAMTAIDLKMDLMRCTHAPVAVTVLITKGGDSCALYLTCMACLNKAPKKDPTL